MVLSFLPASSPSATPCTRTLHYSSSLYLLRRNPRCTRVFKLLCSSSSSTTTTSTKSSTPVDQSQHNHNHPVRGNYAGVRLQETVVNKLSKKSRLDSWISSRIQGVSRARIQSSIRSGLVSVNGRIISKVSHVVKAGDKVDCTISELQPLRAEPEDIPLDIVYEDAHLLVVNKPAHMVVHPAPGNANGTLVNVFLLIKTLLKRYSSNVCNDSVRPGIVHRLDKGTSGLLVVAKDEHSHACLSEQFKNHTICRVYLSLTVGVPSPSYGRIAIPISRDSNNRIRMAAVSDTSNRHARHAASRVIEILADGGSALLEWRLETGRTHQIRAHAKYLGIPLLGDEVYGGTKNMALSLLRARTHSSNHGHLLHLVSKLQRPCLHAFTLGFKHPHTDEDMQFSCPPPADFAEVLSQLRAISTKKVIYQCASKSNGTNVTYYV
ncbi:RNA pseudouridine synthase 2, chloroplastic isoform X1 [Cinnamomum micranthum f. kanehirae]|uniref:Pseudouridine synthase n=1 Tax=Cinnamomum micranthum f. kanehirae TaxID=337451 RepID=A0A3S3MVJ6_9MAGN|nr:RNA pseudouridine synthase 2, chloroplastic isoform X1 [Cinnamomum micranthum f. kanehirae]